MHFGHVKTQTYKLTYTPYQVKHCKTGTIVAIHLPTSIKKNVGVHQWLSMPHVVGVVGDFMRKSVRFPCILGDVHTQNLRGPRNSRNVARYTR